MFSSDFWRISMPFFNLNEVIKHLDINPSSIIISPGPEKGTFYFRLANDPPSAAVNIKRFLDNIVTVNKDKILGLLPMDSTDPTTPIVLTSRMKTYQSLQKRAQEINQSLTKICANYGFEFSGPFRYENQEDFIKQLIVRLREHNASESETVILKQINALIQDKKKNDDEIADLRSKATKERKITIEKKLDSESYKKVLAICQKARETCQNTIVKIMGYNTANDQLNPPIEVLMAIKKFRQTVFEQCKHFDIGELIWDNPQMGLIVSPLMLELQLYKKNDPSFIQTCARNMKMDFSEMQAKHSDEMSNLVSHALGLGNYFSQKSAKTVVAGEKRSSKSGGGTDYNDYFRPRIINDESSPEDIIEILKKTCQAKNSQEVFFETVDPDFQNKPNQILRGTEAINRVYEILQRDENCTLSQTVEILALIKKAKREGLSQRGIKAEGHALLANKLEKFTEKMNLKFKEAQDSLNILEKYKKENSKYFSPQMTDDGTSKASKDNVDVSKKILYFNQLKALQNDFLKKLSDYTNLKNDCEVALQKTIKPGSTLLTAVEKPKKKNTAETRAVTLNKFILNNASENKRFEVAKKTIEDFGNSPVQKAQDDRRITQKILALEQAVKKNNESLTKLQAGLHAGDKATLTAVLQENERLQTRQKALSDELLSKLGLKKKASVSVTSTPPPSPTSKSASATSPKGSFSIATSPKGSLSKQADDKKKTKDEFENKATVDPEVEFYSKHLSDLNEINKMVTQVRRNAVKALSAQLAPSVAKTVAQPLGADKKEEATKQSSADLSDRLASLKLEAYHQAKQKQKEKEEKAPTPVVQKTLITSGYTTKNEKASTEPEIGPESPKQPSPKDSSKPRTSGGGGRGG